MLSRGKKNIIFLGTTLLVAGLAGGILSANAAHNEMKKANEATVFQGQQFFLAGVDNLAVELRYVNGKLNGLYFWNNAENPVSINVLNQNVILPGKQNIEVKATPVENFLITVKPYDATMEENLKGFFPGQNFYFARATDHVGYDMYTAGKNIMSAPAGKNSKKTK